MEGKKRDQMHKVEKGNLKILTLVQSGFNLLTERDPVKMLQLFSHETCSLIQATCMTIGIIEDTEYFSGKFCTTNLKGEQINSSHTATCSLDESILHPLYYGQSVLRYSDLSSSQRSTFSEKSFLGVPIRSSTRIYGIIYFMGTHNEIEFCEEDEYIAEIMAAELALLYEHINVHANFQQQIDSLQLEIIDLKNIENDLRYNKECIKLALDVGQMNCWNWNFKTNDIEEFGFFASLTRSTPDIERLPFDNFLNRVIPEDREHILKLLNQAIEQGTILQVSFRAINSDSKIEYYYAVGQVLYGEQDTPESIIGVTTLITKFKKIEDSMRRDRMELAQIARTNFMEEMASTLAHELNQPLTVINAYLCGCLRRIENGFQEIAPIIEAMIKVRQNVELAGEILERVKEFVQEGELQYQYVNINDLIKKPISLRQYDGFDDLKATIVFDLAENLPDIKVDIVQIKQALLNIIRNGIEATNKAESRTPVITIRSAQINSNAIAIMIEDNGPGIDEAARELLFTPYFTTKPDGMGMGLTIAHNIISAHNGQLSARNLPQGGACFQFSLPMNEPEKTSLKL